MPDTITDLLYRDGPNVRPLDGLASLMTEEAIEAVRDEKTGIWFVPAGDE